MHQLESVNLKDTMRVEVYSPEQDESIVIFQLQGFVDTYNSPDFIALVESYKNKNLFRFVFVCDCLAFVSAAALEVFLDIRQSLRANGGDLLLVNVKPDIVSLINRLGFGKVFAFAECSLDDIAIQYRQLCIQDDASSVFPAVIRCPICKSSLQADHPGTFRCSECKNVLSLDDKLNITFS